jgi:hypothetical protein
MTPAPEWERELVLARARRNLAERELRAAVNDAALAGAGVADLAHVLQTAQPEAKRLLAELEREREPGGQLPEDAYTVAERYAVGELSREQLVDTLSAWSYVPEREMKDYWDDIGVTPGGSFSSTVGRALRDGLIDDETYDEILRRSGPAE